MASPSGGASSGEGARQMSLGVAVLVTAGVVAVVIAMATGWRKREREGPHSSDHLPNEFLQAPPTSFPAFPTAADRRLLDIVRDQVSAEAHVDTFAEDPERVGLLLAVGSGASSGGELVSFALPAFDLAQLTMTRPDVTTSEAAVGPPPEPAADLTAVDLTAARPPAARPADAVRARPLNPPLAPVDLTDVDLTDERSPSISRARPPRSSSRPGWSSPWPCRRPTADDASRTLDPVVQVLIDRIRVKQAVARACGLSSESTPRDHPSRR